jgi:hypothetical protein
MRCRVAVALFLVGCSTVVASAQIRSGGEFQINTYTTSYQIGRAVASDAAGNFVVVWDSYRQDGSDFGVFGQRFDLSGAALGSEFQVNTYTPGNQYYSSVASSAAGNFVVVWQSYAQDGSDYGIFAQRFDASGARSGSEFRVNSYTSLEQRYPSVASTAGGDFVVVWMGCVPGVSSCDISGQRYDSSGASQGGEFRVNSYTPWRQDYPVVASDGAGGFLVAWASADGRGDGDEVFAQRYDAVGVPQGGEFRVNTYTTGSQGGIEQGCIAASPDGAGGFVVVWDSDHQDGDAWGIFGQRYDAAGAPSGSEFQVNSYTTDEQVFPRIAPEANGGFVVTWQSGSEQAHDSEVFARRFDALGLPRGVEFQVNTYTTNYQGLPTVASDPAGNFIVAWTSVGQDRGSLGVFGQRHAGTVAPAALAVDPTGNSVLEVGESVQVKPSWTNVSAQSQTFDGVGVSFTGPTASGVSYGLADGNAQYGTIDTGGTAQCSDCYQVQVTSTGMRPAMHWDATLSEHLTPTSVGGAYRWSLHIGESFTDVPKTSGYYRFVETLLHKGVAGGCTASSYCPASTSTRAQMSIFALVAKEGSLYAPPACGATPMFTDVPVTSPYCKWVEEMVRRGVVGGCGGGNFCPTGAVTRGQMPIFVLKTLDPTLNPPACGTPIFGDVLASSPYCKWIEELARRGVVSGCGGGNYCPTSPVNRAQMAVFISATFGLTLYGP